MELPIAPVVEMYPIEAVLSKQERKWEPLPTGRSNTRNREIRKHLEAAAGIYALFDSLGCPIYVGKTEKQNLWKEMTNAFNREVVRRLAEHLRQRRERRDERRHDSGIDGTRGAATCDRRWCGGPAAIDGRSGRWKP